MSSDHPTRDPLMTTAEMIAAPSRAPGAATYIPDFKLDLRRSHSTEELIGAVLENRVFLVSDERASRPSTTVAEHIASILRG